MNVTASALLLVALGGAAGSAGRAAIALALPGSPLAATLLDLGESIVVSVMD